MATIIDGRAFARRILEFVAAEVAELKSGHGLTPGLATILVGEDPASEVYVRNKVRQTIEAGMASEQYKLEASVPETELLALIHKLNHTPSIHGILVQLPLPAHLNAANVINAIEPAKDVDGFHISNVGLLGSGQKAMLPCTPLGCLLMLRAHLGSLKGKNALVIGRSNIVGKPMSQLLLADDCTVTVAHRFSKNLADHCQQADILVVAVGKPNLIPGAWIKPGAVVLDVGINRIEKDGKWVLVGDIDFASASTVAGGITPVPGGVGPMTIACLLLNTLTAFCRSTGLSDPANSGFKLAEDIGIVNEHRYIG